MASEIVVGHSLQSGNGTLTSFSFVPAVPHGAAIAEVFVDALVGGAYGETAVTLDDGGYPGAPSFIPAPSEETVTGSLTAATKVTPATVAWTGDTVTVTFGAAPASGTNNILLQYVASY